MYITMNCDLLPCTWWLTMICRSLTMHIRQHWTSCVLAEQVMLRYMQGKLFKRESAGHGASKTGASACENPTLTCLKCYNRAFALVYLFLETFQNRTTWFRGMENTTVVTFHLGISLTLMVEWCYSREGCAFHAWLSTVSRPVFQI